MHRSKWEFCVLKPTLLQKQSSRNKATGVFLNPSDLNLYLIWTLVPELEISGVRSLMTACVI